MHIGYFYYKYMIYSAVMPKSIYIHIPTFNCFKDIIHMDDSNDVFYVGLIKQSFLFSSTCISKSKLRIEQ